MVGTTRLFDKPSEVLLAMQMADYPELASQAFLERKAVKEFPLTGLEGTGGRVRLKSYAWDKIVLTTICRSASVLIITNNWSPYWRVWVDGKESMVFIADYAFQGVYCPAGHSEVTLRYMPPYRIN